MIGALSGKRGINCLAIDDFKIMAGDATRTPKISRATGRGRRWSEESQTREEEEEEWKSLPVIYFRPRSSGNQAVSEGGIRARAQDYKVTDEGTDGRRGSRCSRAIR